MSRSSLGRWAPLRGIAFVVLWIAAFAVALGDGSDRESDARIVAHYADSGNRAKAMTLFLPSRRREPHLPRVPHGSAQPDGAGRGGLLVSILRPAERTEAPATAAHEGADALAAVGDRGG